VPPAVATDFASSRPCPTRAAASPAYQFLTQQDGPHPIRHREALAFYPVLDSGKDDRRLAAARGSPRWIGRARGASPKSIGGIGGLPPKTAPAFGIEATEVPWPIPASAGPITEVAGIFGAKNHHPICDLARWLHLRSRCRVQTFLR
jgi:hypothetical protein